LQIETADVSLIGHREENQDRVAVAAADQAVLLVVIDGRHCNTILIFFAVADEADIRGFDLQ
jgi:hypothetical protein